MGAQLTCVKGINRSLQSEVVSIYTALSLSRPLQTYSMCHRLTVAEAAAAATLRSNNVRQINSMYKEMKRLCCKDLL